MEGHRPGDRKPSRARRSIIPVAIIVVGGVIMIWSQWSSRQARIQTALAVEQLIAALCAGTPPQGIRWADHLVTDAVALAAVPLCQAGADRWGVVVVDSQSSEPAALDVLLTVDGETKSRLTVQPLDDGLLLIRGWSSE